jgi:hypothetical protein
MHGSRSVAALVGLACLRCLDGPALGHLPAPPQVIVTPSRPEGSARVVRLEVRGLDALALDASELWLFSGELSDYHVNRIHRRDLPETLMARQIAVSAWTDAAGTAITVAPHTVLEPGSRYTLSAPGLGRLLIFEVSAADPTPLLARLWPPPGLAADAALVLCAEQAPTHSLAVALEPSGSFARIEAEFADLPSGQRCVSARLPPIDAEQPLVFAAEVGGYLFDPAPLVRAPGAALSQALCAEGELQLGPGCARLDDDRLLIRNVDEPALWALDNGAGSNLQPLAPGERWLVRGLEPDSEQHLRGRALSLGGVETPFELVAHTLPERAHLVLNEVLFNPLGAEPAAEWVELVNDGAGQAELAGLFLRDGGGLVELPSASLEPGQYALLVRNDFVPAASGDVPLSSETLLLRVPALGRAGLSNSGEALQLEDAKGRVLSRFPALPSRRAGVALARSTPHAFDEDAQSFGEHASPGASPGTANRLARDEPSR